MSAHSLLQETSAGRNVITLFSTVNNSTKLFFKNVCKCIALHAHPCHADIHQRLHLKIALVHAMVVQWSCTQALTRLAAKHVRDHRRPHGSLRIIQSERITHVFDVSCPQSCTHRFARRTSLFARKMRELFSKREASGVQFRWRAPLKKKTRDVAVAGRLNGNPS